MQTTPVLEPPTPKAILLVEDEALLRRILCESLEDQGYRVESVADADTAWAMIRAGLAFDILVTDVRMPGSMDGLALAQQVQALRNDVPIVVMSGYSPHSLIERHWGVFLSKPFTIGTLVAAIRPPK